MTGTDTDVGKTIVTASLAAALRAAGEAPTIVKPVQTGLAPDDEGDAARAGRLAGCDHVELARFRKPADPWSAALAEGAPLVSARTLAHAIDGIAGAIVVEGAGGLAVPLDEREHFGHLAVAAGLPIVLAVGLRLGCLNHALLTIGLCDRMRLDVAGLVLVERWGPVAPDYRADVERTLEDKAPSFGILPFAQDEATAVAAGASLFTRLPT